MREIFWAIPGRLAGRAGPNLRPWSIAELSAGGIAAVLSVNDGELCHPLDFEQAGMSYACVPLSENAPPRPGDVELCVQALPQAYAFAASHFERERSVLVHCRSGKDRTGLFLAYALLRQGVSPSIDDAIEEVRRMRPIAFSAPGWPEHARDVLSRL